MGLQYGFPQACSVFSGQTVWARNFNAEMNITSPPAVLPMPDGGREAFSRFSTAPKDHQRRRPTLVLWTEDGRV